MKVFRRTIFLLLAAFILLSELGCGDQYRPVANPIVGPGGQPQSTHFAYVVNYNPNGNGSTTTIDVSGDSVSWLQPMGVGSIYEALPSLSTALFVANSGNDTVSDFLAYISGAVTTVGLPPGSHPVFLTSTKNGNMYVLNSGFTPDMCPSTGSVSNIVTATGSVTNTACVGLNPINMVQAASGGQIFVLNQGDNMGQGSVTVLNPVTLDLVKTLNPADGLGLNPVYATSSVDGSYIFVVTQGDGVHPGALDILTPGTSPTVARIGPAGREADVFLPRPASQPAVRHQHGRQHGQCLRCLECQCCQYAAHPVAVCAGGRRYGAHGNCRAAGRVALLRG